jgi:CBS domain-containing protein
VNNIASYPLQKIDANDSILTAAEQMSSKKIRKLAVVNDDKVIGIITSTDIVTHLANKKNL